MRGAECRLLCVLFIVHLQISIAWSASINSLLRTRALLSDFETDQQTNLLNTLVAGAQLAIEHCQRQFMWERWNCPDGVFSRRGRGRQPATRETAYVSAITAAGIIYSITYDCSAGYLLSCSCEKKVKIIGAMGNSSFTVSCMENLVFAERATDQFLFFLEEGATDTHSLSNLHNNKVGKEVVRHFLRQECTCKGMSNSCSVKSCWMKLPPFADIASKLKELYEYAIRVDDNSANMKHVNSAPPDQLIFSSESPDYCKNNLSGGWAGTSGRVCSRAKGPNISMSERRSCRRLCRSCGYRVKHKEVTVTWHCNCSFEWCCKVNCNECTKVVEQHFCE